MTDSKDWFTSLFKSSTDLWYIRQNCSELKLKLRPRLLRLRRNRSQLEKVVSCGAPEYWGTVHVLRSPFIQYF